MGDGYSILVWDDFGAGLVKINPRLITEGVDLYGNPCNWWPCDSDVSDDEIIEAHALLEKYGTCFSIIR